VGSFLDFIAYEPIGIILIGLAVLAANMFMFVTLWRKAGYLSESSGFKPRARFERLAFLVTVAATLLAFLIWFALDR